MCTCVAVYTHTNSCCCILPEQLAKLPNLAFLTLVSACISCSNVVRATSIPYFATQEYAKSAPANKILEDHLLAAGLAMSGSAVCWLTPAQLLVVEQELERMEMNLSFELTAWWLSDVLARARVTNNRMSRAGANSW